MDNLNVLPENWESKAIRLDRGATQRFLSLWNRKPGVIVDDDCPLDLSIVVIDRKLRVFRINDPAVTLLVLKALNFSPPITNLFSETKVPELKQSIICQN